VRAPLAFAAAGPEDLIAGRFGLREPALTAPPIDLGAIAAFVVPGLAFDRSGGRIGWGHGYYDATLAAAEPTALRIGLAFELQLIDRVPRDAHDVALHAVITEAATYWVA
jgi:5-formyltetrahydrofolate cyclo-ligase